MGVLDAVADVRKNTENYTGDKCIININNFRASVLYSNIFESLGANYPMITVRKFSPISYKLVQVSNWQPTHF